MRRLAGVLGAAALLLAGAPAAEARDVTVRSFDGTPIAASFLPAPDGGRAPTVLMTHGWGLVRDRGDDSGGTAMFGSVGAATLQRAGYNVLTWDSRGFGES